ncbi:MAG: deoxyribodipyrimidine photo-lyase, partial [Pseudomonadota bacterium]
MGEVLHIVWFKRDLRVADHAALAGAAAFAREDGGAVLPLYVAEPGLWREPDMAGRHWAFIAESLEELQSQLAALGQP